MSSLFSGINARFRGQSSKPNSASPSYDDQSTSGTEPTPPPGTTIEAGSRSKVIPSSQSVPRMPPIPKSPSLSQSIGMASGEHQHEPQSLSPLPIWLHPTYSKHIVRGNFTALSVKPKAVETGDWIAHQAVEHYRLLWNFVRVVFEKEADGNSVCNTTTCPKMSAGGNHSYTWLNSRLEPTEIPAHEYMSLMQRWIAGKVDDAHMFPTDPAGVSFALNPAITLHGVPSPTDSSTDWIGKRSGFPTDFSSTCRTIFLQMFRVYAHLYWSHYVDPFYHLNLEKQLNSCFSHFLLTATSLDMLRGDDLEPVQYLVDLWAANGTFPPGSKAYSFANFTTGEQLMQSGAGA